MKTLSLRSRVGQAVAVSTVTLVVALAACLRAPQVEPTASLAPHGPDSGPARTRGPFAVVYAAPRGEHVDRAQPGVTVLFSRAMRTVETPDDRAVPDVAVRTQSGPVAGTWRWTGTRGLLFSPAKELPGGSDFVVTVPAGTRSVDGSALARPYTLEFHTDGPRLVSVAPQGPSGIKADALPSDAVLRVSFDQPVEPAALEAVSTLRVYAGDGDPGHKLRLHAARDPGSSVAAPDGGFGLLLTPEAPIPLDRDVELFISDSLRGTGGPRPMAASVTETMRTHGALRLVDFYCPRITPNGRCRANGDVKVTLSTPVDPGELKAHLQGLPPPRPLGKAEKRQVGAKTAQWLDVAPQLGAEYKVTLTAGLRDVYGQKLARDAQFTFEVESPLVKPPTPPLPPPTASAEPLPPPPPPSGPKRGRSSPPPPPPRGSQAPGDVRPRREALPYRLDLGIVGEVLEANGPHRIPVGAINIPTYASLAAPLNEDQVRAWHDARGQDFLARNALTPAWTITHADINEREVDFLDLDAALAAQHGRGGALLAIMAPGGQSKAETLVSVTDLGVTAKLGPYGGLVWVTHLSTGKPVAGASVVFRDQSHEPSFSGTTDAEGVVVVPVERFDATVTGKSDLNETTLRQDASIVVRAGDDWTVTRVRRSQVEARLTPDFSSMSKLGQWAGMLFADHGIFRPGETARVSGIVRVAAPGGLRSVPGRQLRVELRDPTGEQLFDGRATCDELGTFAIDVPVPKNAALGYATLTATVAAGGKSNTFEPGVFTHVIRVLAYTPDEFKVSAESDQPAYVRGDSAVFSATGEFLYGAPMPGASVTSQVTRQEVPFTPPGLDGFTTEDDVNTGDIPETTKAAQAADSEDGTLDAKGTFVRKVALTFPDQRRPERINFDVDVQDLSRRTVSARAGAVVHPGEFYVALRTPVDRFAAVGAPYRAEFLAVEPSGVHRAGVKVTVDLVLRKWNTVVGEQPDGTPSRKSEPVDTVQSSCSALSTEKLTGCTVRFPHAGYFVVRATATDPRGNTLRSSVGVYGTDEAGGQAAWAGDDKSALKLEANKASYRPGETAKILLRSPYRTADALITVERNGILWRKVVPIEGPLPVVSVPIGADFYPNAFVSVVAVRGRIQPAPPAGADLGAPEFRLGYLPLNVDPEAHRLHVAVSTQKREYQPGEMVDADVLVTGAGAKPANSTLTFYAVDEGVLALTSYKTPDPLPAFVHARKLAVFALDNRELLARVVPMKAGERVASLGYEYSLASNGGYDKGHDGGDGDGAKRADFRTTAYFEAGRKTDDDGRAHFRFKLPDGLTTYRLMAVAAAADDRFGSGDSKVTTFRHLMARPALPRFVRVGDTLEASVVVASKVEESAKGAKSRDAGAPLTVEVRFEPSGLEAKGPVTRQITMPRGGQAEVRFPVVATRPGEATLTFTVRSGPDVDRVVLTRTVTLPTTQESAAVYGETDGTVSIALGDTRLMRPDFGGLDIHVAPTALVGLGSALDKVVGYAYGCTEQLSSRILPVVMTMDLGRGLGMKVPPEAGALLDTAVTGILKRQNDNGGFGFWDGSASEPWLSAYAMLALEGAAAHKRFVPADALGQGRSYLNQQLAAVTRVVGRAEAGVDEEVKDAAAGAAPDAGGDPTRSLRIAMRNDLDFARAALIGDVLASTGSGNPAALNVLFDARDGIRLFAQASLLHAMAKAEMNPAELKTLEQEIETHLRVGPNEVVVDEDDDAKFEPLLDSRARTLAMVLRAFVAVDPHHPLAPRLARGLLALRQEGGWRTTQEDAWALLALADYRKAQEPDDAEVTARAFLRGASVLQHVFPKGSTDDVNTFVPASRVASATGGVLAFEAGRGKLYYSAELNYETTALPKQAVDEGLFVQKYVRSIPATALKEALATIPTRTTDTVTAGELVVVDLLFESAEPRDQVVLDDPLPAGLEALNYDLDTTSAATRDAQTKQDATRDAKKTVWLGTTYRVAPSHRQVKDDRVLTFFEHLDPGMYRVSYLARATAIGLFVSPPTRIAAMYTPEVYGRTATSMLTVRAKP